MIVINIYLKISRDFIGLQNYEWLWMVLTSLVEKNEVLLSIIIFALVYGNLQTKRELFLIIEHEKTQEINRIE